MTTDEILNLDCKDEENKKKLARIISKMKPVQRIFEKEGKQTIDIEFLERIVHGFCTRYGYYHQGITTYYEYDYNEKGRRENKRFVFYTVSIITPDKKWIGNAYGKTLWEVQAKMIIKIFAHIKSEDNK